MNVFPATFFGSIDYYRALAKHPQVILEAKEHFPKQSYRNRCDILSANGILSLSIPVERPNGSKTVMYEIEMPDTENWRPRHWRSIKSAYQSAPFFDYYGMEVEELLHHPTSNLFAFNSMITERIITWLDLEISLEASNSFYPPVENDPRDIFGRKGSTQPYEVAPYMQVFPSAESYKSSLSILDAIMCIGPMARKLIVAQH